MSKKLDDVTKSIKSKLSFDDYTPSSPNDAVTSEHKNIKTEKPNAVIKPKKVKRTFYILEEVAEQFDDFYAKKLSEKCKVDKSDIITQAIKNLLEDKDAKIGVY